MLCFLVDEGKVAKICLQLITNVHPESERGTSRKKRQVFWRENFLGVKNFVSQATEKKLSLLAGRIVLRKKKSAVLNGVWF